ncbi:MAG: hypothetical protein ACYTFK_01275 [Planctomycetota bacterium]|jgi:hypothetical protein
MDAKFFDSLYEGDSANGVKLGMGLTGGDFWARISGCQNLYRGADENAVDFETVLATGDVDEGSVVVPDFAQHNASSSYLYVLRRVNICGNEEQTFAAAVKVTFDGQGDLAESGCNDAFALTATQAGGPKALLLWYYCPVAQSAGPAKFNIYWDSGTGLIDYETALGSVDYVGRRYYSFETAALSGGSYRFCVRAVTKDGLENDGLGTVAIQIRNVPLPLVEVLRTQAV